MNNKWDAIGEQGFQFFGKMSATISHEINNALAIINENAGLLQDFTLMADKGMPLDHERLNNLAGKLTHQVRRAEGIVKNMNRFAHSVDETLKSIDLGNFVDESTIPQINNKHIDRILIPVPDIKKQIEISGKIEKIQSTLISFEKKQVEKLNQLKALKSSLLDKAFKGELV